MKPHFETLAVHGAETASYEGAISFPIFQTSTYCESERGYSYSRSSNPTRNELEQTIALLEGGKFGFSFSSGLAAVSTVFSLLRAGDTAVVSEDLYGGTDRGIRQIWKGLGIRFSFADTRDLEKTERAFDDRTKLLFLETPTNPMMRVSDIRKMADLAHAHGAILCVDNTFLTPALQKPLSMGADVVVHSGTKLLAGHHDTLCGHLVTNSEQIAERFGLLQRTLGNALAPFDSWLTLRGIQTLPLRVETHCENALRAAESLEKHPRVKAVHYPFLPSHPQYELMKKQASGGGCVLSFELADDDVWPVLRGGKFIRFAESLGGTTSLITYPTTQTHASVPEKVRLSLGITPRLLRLSVGLEHSDDLLEDLEEMLAKHS